MEIKNSTLLVAGGSSGLGAACVSQFLKRGASVIALDQKAPDPTSSSSSSERYYFKHADVTREDEVVEALKEGQAQCGGISGAVICAGVLHAEKSFGKSGVASLDAFRHVLDVNVVGTFNVVRLVAQAIAQGPSRNVPNAERGVIVMTSSIAAFDGQSGQSAYAASKGAIASMTLPLARELARYGIRVVSIAPGVFETPMMAAASDPVREDLLKSAVFPVRFGEPTEFASSVVHVFENPMFNGCTLRLDGAMRMSP
jgi:NAD(P)-dependent dehydrogenase (short-subunit alcohol dehydrogenase family)